MKSFALQHWIWRLALMALFSCACFADGRVRFMRRMDATFDQYVQSPTVAQQQWLRDQFWRMEVFSPHFDRSTSWYSNGLAYQDLYAIYKDSELVSQQPDWILKDAGGNRLYIPWGCGGGTCPQYAADVANPAYRRWWIDEARRRLAAGYRGLWIDDVNMEFRVGNGNGTQVAPIDRNTGAPMTWENWRRYIAEFTEQIRQEITGYEVLHNSIWFAGPAGVRDADQYIRRQISSADIINVEHGVNDPGLTGGTGDWSIRALLAFVDRVHSMGKSVVIDDFAKTAIEKEYALASYLLINEQSDALGNMVTTPDNWWAGYSLNLGKALAPRTIWNNVIRRDFEGGMVLVNEPGSPARTVTLPAPYQTIAGASVTSVTLNGKMGIVLIGQTSDTIAPVIQGITAVPATTSATVTWTTNEDADTKVEYGASCCGLTGPVSGAMTKTHAVTLGQLTPGTTYSYRVSSRDASGNVAVSPILGFSTLQSDTTAPSVLTALPSGTAVETVSTVQAQFSEAIAPTTVTRYTVLLVRSGSTAAVGATVTYDPLTRTANLKPTTTLLAATTYKVTVRGGSSGIKDASGNPMAADYVWSFTTKPAPQWVTAYLSDLPFTVVQNGWGPVERDRSNGESAAGDGRAMTLDGVIFKKGLGVHAGSEIRYAMGGACKTFASDIGVDDEVGTYGSVVFQVWVDGQQVYNSGTMTGTTPRKKVNLSVEGKTQLTLIVTDAGDNPNSDHADWAGVRLACAR